MNFLFSVYRKIKNWFTDRPQESEVIFKPLPKIEEKTDPVREMPKVNEPASSTTKEDSLSFALEYVFGNEGGFSNVSGDKGGATMWGVTKVEWEKFHKRLFTDGEIRYMKRDDAKIIYEERYWKKAGLHQLRDKYKATAIFDQCVNWGPTVGVKFGRQAAGLQTKSVIPLADTECDFIDIMNRKKFIFAFSDIASSNYSRIAMKPTYWKFRKGWLNRAERLKTLAIEDKQLSPGQLA